MNYSERIQSIIVEASSTIIQTMKMMDDTRTKSLLVFEYGRFLGMITNGDLQRAIIANEPFSMSIGNLIDNASKKYACQGDDIHQIKDWMKEVRAEYMPVLDAEGNLADVIFWVQPLKTFPTLILTGFNVGLFNKRSQRSYDKGLSDDPTLIKM